MSWQIDWHKPYAIEELTSRHCPLCPEPSELYITYDGDISVLCSNHCGFEIYAVVVNDDAAEEEIEFAGIYYARDNFVMYIGDGRWLYCFADGSDVTEEGADSCIDVGEMANKLKKMCLLV